MSSFRALIVRHLLGRLRIDDDILRHLTTFQRLGETLEIQAPREMLPIGARTVLRAIRTRGAVQIRPDWLWPYWAERQLDPRSPSFEPRGHLPFMTNVTHRNWTMVGNIGSPWEAIVDPCGLVTPWFDGWSLDWWIGADDRWRFPSREPGVRQTLMGSTPIVETVIRVPGGDAVQRVYTIVGEDELVVMEIENQSPVPFAVAFALRPYNPEGLAVLERITMEDGVVLADGRPALLLPREPSRSAASTYAEGDSVHTVFEGKAGTESPLPVRDPAGLAQAAFVYPLAHRATIRVAMPLVRHGRTKRRRRAHRRVSHLGQIDLGSLPKAEDVSRGWRAQLDRGMDVNVPDARLQQALDANRGFMLLFHDGDEITPGPFTYHRFWFRDAAYQLAAMDRWGFHAEVAEVLRSYPRRQHKDGFFASQRHEWDANGAAIWTIAEHYRLTSDRELLDALIPSVRRGVRWINKKKRQRRHDAPEVQGLLPAGISAEHLGPFDFYYWDSMWSLRGLLDAAELFAEVGDEEGATNAAESAASLRAAIMSSLEMVAERLGQRVMPAGPSRGFDAGMIGSLASCYPLGLLPADDPFVVGSLAAIRDEFCIDEAFYQSISHTGLGTYLTLQLAFVELEGGDPRAWDRLKWMLAAATPTFAWPEAIHPQLGGGCMGDGHHGWAAADFLSFVRNVLIRETPDGSIALMTLLPPGWEGQPVDVRNAPTHHGLVSYSLRWHGDRPALLWECEREGVRLVAPGLDEQWSTSERTGDALLAPVLRPTARVRIDLQAPLHVPNDGTDDST